MNRIIPFLLGGILLPATLMAAPPGKPDIVVMTQNQYLGADLTPIVAAESPEEYNLAVLNAMFQITANNTPERVQALAETILERKPHLVGLQEMFRFDCVETGPRVGILCGRNRQRPHHSGRGFQRSGFTGVSRRR